MDRIYVLIITQQLLLILFASGAVCGQSADWFKMSKSDTGDTLFLRYDSTSVYMPVKFDELYSNGSKRNAIDQLFYAKRDDNTIGVLFSSDIWNIYLTKSMTYAKFLISKDTVWVLNNGAYLSLNEYNDGTLPWKLIDASTVVVPHQNPSRTVIDYYSDDAMVYRYTCDTTLTKRGRKKPWQRYPWPPPGNYHEDK